MTSTSMTMHTGAAHVGQLKRYSLPGFAASLIIFVLSAYPAQADGRSPSAVVKGLQQGLLATMKQAKELGINGRYERLRPVIDESLYLPAMVATATAPYWNDGTTAERRRLIEAFRRMIASQVATFFDEYDGESFRIIRERKTNGPTVLVDTLVVRQEEFGVSITYVTAKIRDRWWIVDIIVEGGISEVKVRQNEYSSLLKEGKLDALAHALNAQADKILAAAKTASVTNRN